MGTTVIFQDQFEVPRDVASVEDFRRWAFSSRFPDQGRTDFVAGHIEVDMTPEELFTHGTLKGEIYATLLAVTKPEKLGHLFTDSGRVTCPEANLSVEPDVVFVSREAIRQGRVRLIAKAAGGVGRFLELEGPPDMVVEIVSDHSVRKDTERLFTAYHEAGILEYWLVDARSETLRFDIYRQAATSYEQVTVDDEGYQTSAVFRRRFRLDRSADESGVWWYDLRMRS